MKKKVYYHDTDSGGVVYYANYLKYFEEARTEYMLEKGADIKELSDRGILFVVRKVEIEYKSPARYGDILNIITAITKIRNVSVDFIQEVRKNDKLLVSSQTNLVCVNNSFQPCVIPKEMQNLIA